MEKIKNSIVRHLKRHAPNGSWIHQRRVRNNLHADSAPLFNQAVVALAMEGMVDLDVAGPFRKKVIRLKTA